MRILLVDDAALLRTLFVRIARSLGHDVIGEAENVAAVPALASTLLPDAIVIDGRLAGGELARLLRDLREAVPQSALLVVAALEETAIVRLARENGAAGVIRRPFSRVQIRGVLEAGRTKDGRGPV